MRYAALCKQVRWSSLDQLGTMRIIVSLLHEGGIFLSLSWWFCTYLDGYGKHMLVVFEWGYGGKFDCRKLSETVVLYGKAIQGGEVRVGKGPNHLWNDRWPLSVHGFLLENTLRRYSDFSLHSLETTNMRA